MLLIAGLKAFVPKETAEQFSAALQGMLNDGTLQGLGTLVSDIQAIKRNQEQIMLALGHIYATRNPVPGSPNTGPCNLALAEHGTDGRSSGSVGAGGEPDDGRGVHFTAHNEVGRAAE